MLGTAGDERAAVDIDRADQQLGQPARRLAHGLRHRVQRGRLEAQIGRAPGVERRAQQRGRRQLVLAGPVADPVAVAKAGADILADRRLGRQQALAGIRVAAQAHLERERMPALDFQRDAAKVADRTDQVEVDMGRDRFAQLEVRPPYPGAQWRP